MTCMFMVISPYCVTNYVSTVRKVQIVSLHERMLIGLA